MKRQKMIIFFDLFCCFLHEKIGFEIPAFFNLFYELPKDDAIIILLGPDFKARQKEANELVDKGMADYSNYSLLSQGLRNP